MGFANPNRPTTSCPPACRPCEATVLSQSARAEATSSCHSADRRCFNLRDEKRTAAVRPCAERCLPNVIRVDLLLSEGRFERSRGLRQQAHPGDDGCYWIKSKIGNLSTAGWRLGPGNLDGGSQKATFAVAECARRSIAALQRNRSSRAAPVCLRIGRVLLLLLLP